MEERRLIWINQLTESHTSKTERCAVDKIHNSPSPEARRGQSVGEVEDRAHCYIHDLEQKLGIRFGRSEGAFWTIGFWSSLPNEGADRRWYWTAVSLVRTGRVQFCAIRIRDRRSVHAWQITILLHSCMTSQRIDRLGECVERTVEYTGGSAS